MIVDAVREVMIQALLLALRLMAPVTAIGAVAALIGIYTVACAAAFYAVAWLVREALGLFLVMPA